MIDFTKVVHNWVGKCIVDWVLSSAEARFWIQIIIILRWFEIQEAKATNGQKNDSAKESSGECLSKPSKNFEMKIRWTL